MSDAPGGAPQPSRSPGIAAAEAGARGPRPPQVVLQAQPTGVVSAATSATRQVVLGVQAGGSSRLSGPIGSLPVGVRLVGSNVQFASPTPRLVLSVDQSSPQQQPQLQSSWISISSPNVVTASSRRQVVTTVGTPSTASPLPSTAPSSLLRPLPATSFVTPPAKRQLATMSPTSVSSTAASTVAARKRLKLDPEEQEEVPALRRRLLAHKVSQLHESRDVYTELLAELFFLQAGGNMMDYLGWRKRPPTPQYTEFIHSRRLDDDAGELERIGVMAELRVAGPGATPVALSKQLPAVVAQLSQQGGVPLVPAASGPVIPSGSSVLTSAHSPGRGGSSGLVTPRPGPSTPGTSHSRQPAQRSPIVPGVRQHTRQHAISAAYDTSIGSKEQIVEKAKQEAYIMQRVTELQRDGLWSEKRLPKVQEPSRAKAHWDYLLEEMVWLAADFAQERKWKKAAAKKCARMVQKYFQDKAIQAQKAEKNQELRLKKIASCIAKEIKTFWNNVHKLVEFKHQTMLEERRRQALDQHLSYIVDQTEKYSSWLAESMGKTTGQPSRPESTANSLVHSGGASTPEKKNVSDGEFEPNQSSSDDEETIAKAEAEDAGEEQSEELKLLELESTLPLDDVIKSLPAEVREAVQRGHPTPAATTSSEPQSEIKKEEEEKMEDDDFDASEEDSSDDEETIQEQEKAERNVDHKQELDELADDNNLSMEELMAKYGRPGDPIPGSSADQSSDIEDVKEDLSSSESGSEEDSDDESEEEEEEEGEEKADASGEDIGLSSLLEDIKGIRDMDQLANTVEEYQEYQPTGNTLSSTKVETKVPFLLKHELREYQHVGLEWLVTMYNKRLNGILADEMGLGKTIQTIALLAHLACDKCIWGPHLIVVPTSVMLNWEMEIKKWCPAFKILTYYGSQKERRLKRTGWTKPNAFHICITSYKLVIQDHQSFRRKKWRYLILDEAQNIKNFRSQRWQLLMNFQSQRRLLLTGTPLQNNLMELWSLMHFLMPDVFQSHKEFKEWFVNPVTGMIEGNSEYNEKIIRRLHKVLRPFLLRRLKAEVERQLPKKYEHVVMCRLSKRQRFLYDDFMSRAKTRETLASGNLLSVINVLMQLRKVCNHPNLFEVRPTISPFQMDSITLNVPSLICYALEYNPMKHVSLNALNLLRIEFEYIISAYMAHRIRRAATPRRLIEEIDSQPSPPPPTPRGKIRLNVRATAPQQATQSQLKPGLIQAEPGTSPIVRALTGQNQAVMLRVTGGSPAQGYSVQLVQHAEGVKAIPVASLASTGATTPTSTMSQATLVSSASVKSASATTSTAVSQQDSSGASTSSAASPVLQRVTRPAGFAQLVQTPTGKHILLTSTPTPIPAPGAGTPTANTVLTSGGHRLTVLSKPAAGVITSTITPLNKVLPAQAATPTSTPGTSQVGRPVLRVPPLNVTTTPTQIVTSRPAGSLVATSIVQPISGSRPTLATTTSGATTLHSARILDARVLAMAESIKKHKEQPQQPKSIFYLTELEENKKRDRKQKLSSLASINTRRCEACPLYGEDLLNALNVMNTPAEAQSMFSHFPWSSGAGYVNCRNSQEPHSYHDLWTKTGALADAIFSNEERVTSLRQILSRFVLYVPPVNAPRARLLASHASPSCVWSEQRLEDKLTAALVPQTRLLHPVISAMATQFPDPRLIQYDCGKLQVLEKLLRDLKVGSHRVLIFTQMTRMLDVLEAFLNHQGHIYLRLDGATKVDQRQVLMERFNADKRIFAFILSTRSGGIGVNLTGADTVIFYDSDWNPTMDAQAQDRCHRIGQTRDVHIYRLVSEMTVEENILKKANQKRLLGDLAIEGGNFTTAFFKSSTIQELFKVDSSENDASRRMADVLGSDKEREKNRQQIAKESEAPSTVSGEDPSALTNFESVLAAAEDETDVQAAHTARAEAAAELAEFDENIALEDESGTQAPSQQPGEELSKAEQEVQNIVEKLTPVERYAMRVVEESESAWTAEQLAAAEAEIEQQKREWELGRLRALQEKQREDEEEAEEQRIATASPSNMLTYSGRDAHSQVNVKGRVRALRSQRSLRGPRARGSKPQSIKSPSDSHKENGVVSESSSKASSESDGSSSEESESSDQSSRSESPSNCIDPNSPRTRSRGTVKINLWTLDVSPILPGVKPVKPGSMKQVRGGKGVATERNAVVSPTSNCVKRTGKGMDSDEKMETESSEVDVVGLSNDATVKSTPAKATYTRAKRRSDCSNEGNGPV